MPAWASGRRTRRPRRSGWTRLLIALVLVAGLAVYAALPEPPFSLGGEPLVGPVERVADGDTLEIAGQRVRLVGLDAPEWNQTCARADGTQWPCGRASADRMRAMTRGETVSCRGEMHDRYGRLLAVCKAGGDDLAEALVRDGLAVASGSYQAAEAQARRAGQGIWQGDFARPADWRAAQAAGSTPPQGNPSRVERFLAWIAGLFGS